MKSLNEIRDILNRIDMNLFEKRFIMRCEIDNKFDAGRIFLQCVYFAKCNKSSEDKEWHGRKYYLSEFMTEDEIIKTAYTAFKTAVEHEVMEGFKVDGIILFNPHINYKELLKISHLETSREKNDEITNESINDNLNSIKLSNEITGT